MSRRFSDMRHPIPRPLGLCDLGWLCGATLFGLIVIISIFLFAPKVHAHDAWINSGGYKGKGQAAGEWCCGEGDCFIVKGKIQSDGSAVVFNDDGGVREIVPPAEVQPSPDGQFWRCQRPDGSRRCFFAPPSSM